MATVSALYRYPVKGFTPEPLDELTLTADGRVVGDRVLAFRFPRGTTPQDRDGRDYWPKGDGLCLRDFPALARLKLTYRDRYLRLMSSDGLLVEGDPITDAEAIVAAVTSFVLETDEHHRHRLEQNLPLALVGDGETARFQDRAKGYLSLHSRTSLASLAEAVGMSLDERRFRSNISVSGLEAWAENALIGSPGRIGEVLFDVEAPITRCLATHVDPDAGTVDAPVMTTLTRNLGFTKPDFGVLLVPHPGQAGARIRLGDEVTPIN